jgi:ABC-type dipeptide/oligopeptide/nickel transport system permease subunit
MATGKSVKKGGKNDKLVLILSLTIAFYFGIMIATYYYKIDNPVLGFVREILTIPAILLWLILIVMSIISLSKENKKFSSLSFYTFLLLCATMVLLILTM